MKNRIATNLNIPRGATMVEFALAALVFFGLLGAIVDFGMSLQEYSHLTFIVHRSTQVAAATAATDNFTQCSDVQQAVCAATNQFLPRFGYDSEWARISFTVEQRGMVVALSEAKNCSLVVKAERDTPCFFCFFFPSQKTLQVLDQQMIEDHSVCENLLLTTCAQSC